MFALLIFNGEIISKEFNEPLLLCHYDNALLP